MNRLTEIWFCDRTKKCGWNGQYSELKQIPHPKFENATQGVCPKCAGKRFYVRKEGIEMTTDLEIIIKNQPIDIELAELVGQPPMDFLVLYLDGKQLDGFGTPQDCPTERRRRQNLVDQLNDLSAESLWPDMWINWADKIRTQFNLPPETRWKDFHPVASLKIHRVVHAYSEHDHAAVGLLERVKDKLSEWTLHARNCEESRYVVVELCPIDESEAIRVTGHKLSLAVAEAVRDLLRATK